MYSRVSVTSSWSIAGLVNVDLAVLVCLEHDLDCVDTEVLVPVPAEFQVSPR